MITLRINDIKMVGGIVESVIGIALGGNGY